MNPPGLTSSPAASPDDTARLAAERLWRNLPPGPWQTENESNLVTDEMLRAIIAAAGIYEGDFAGASVRRHLLVNVGAISGVRHDDGSITWTKAETFPERSGDSLSWVDRENARLRKEHEWREAEIDREAELRANAAEVLAAPEHAQFLRQLHKAGVAPDQIRQIVRAEVKAALAAHFEPVGAE
jgi:hypothetical protein